MIGRLHGILIEKHPPQLLIDVGGVGYEVESSLHTFYCLPEINQSVTLLIHTVIREDAHLLFGFYEAKERSLFRTLIKVNGVGAKLALTILSSMDADEFVRCINEHDTAKLVKIPGIGKKTAERLVIETKDRLTSWSPSGFGETSQLTTLDHLMTNSIDQEAISALISLGYKPQEASKMVNAIDARDLNIQQLIKAALRGC